MVYVYSKKSNLNKYIGKNLSVDEIKETLVDLGMDIKGESDEKDPELKIEITAEKADLVSTVGIARAIKYYRGYENKLPKYNIEKSNEKVVVKKSANLSRPKTSCAILRGVNLTQELLDEMIEIQEKIHESFGRNRKKVAIGIYPMSEFEFPVTFSGEKPGDIIFRPLESDKEMNANEILLEHETGKKYGHLLKDLEFYPVFRDKNSKVLSMPPIINSHETGRVNTSHKDLFIEVSGHNLVYLDMIMKVMITTFIDMGAKAQSVKVEYEDSNEVYELNLDSRFETLSLDFVNKLIGLNLGEKDIGKLLDKVMFNLIEIKNGILKVEVPCFKADVWHDVDVADDIARAYGYNNIVPRSPNISSVGEELDNSLFRRRITNTMVNLSFVELYTYILSSTQNQFTKMNLEEDSKKYIRLIDSADQGINMTRTSILPEILSSLHINRKNKYPQRVFENGFTIQVDNSCDTGARNESHLAVAIADSKANYTQIKGALDSLFKLNEVDFKIKEAKIPFLIEGRSAKIFLGKEEIGFIGELHPQILENFGLLVPVAVFEINLDKIFKDN